MQQKITFEAVDAVLPSHGLLVESPDDADIIAVYSLSMKWVMKVILRRCTRTGHSMPKIRRSDTESHRPGFTVLTSTEILIVYSCEGRRHFPDDAVVDENGKGMELRFMSGRELFKKGASQFAFMRHGGGGLTEWWIQKGNGTECLQDHTEKTVLCGGQRWHFALYSFHACQNLSMKEQLSSEVETFSIHVNKYNKRETIAIILFSNKPQKPTAKTAHGTD